MAIALRLCLLLTALEAVLVEDKYGSWFFNNPPNIEYAFRRSQGIPVKGPDFNQCACPPHDTCKVDYKLSADALDFLKIRGVLTEVKVEELKKDHTQEPVKVQRRKWRRDNPHEADDDCCCPVENLMMPTLITQKPVDGYHKILKKN